MIPADRPELTELRDAVRSLLAKAAPLTDVERHGAQPGGYDRALWRRLAAEIGVAALLVPEKCGGVGAGIQEAAVVAEELGRALAPSPFLITAGLAALLLQGSPDEGGLLAEIAAGEVTAAVVYRGADGEVDPAALPVRARETADVAADGTGWRIDGQARFVVDGAGADWFLVLAPTAADVRLFAVAADAPGLACQPMRTLDLTRGQAQMTFTDVPARELRSADAWGTLQAALQRSTVLLAAEQVAGAERALDLAINYIKQRLQFGRPIGSFQALKHRCADLVVDVDRARSALAHATWAADNDPARLTAAAALAAMVAGQAYVAAAQENIQLHGGIGFTWEHPAHLFFRRAKSDNVLLRNPGEHAGFLLDGVIA
jgi:alkylation response protein AidB-like acyl-CoA dehydrogenase